MSETTNYADRLVHAMTHITTVFYKHINKYLCKNVFILQNTLNPYLF